MEFGIAFESFEFDVPAQSRKAMICVVTQKGDNNDRAEQH
jgi:hypothetical protein